MSKEPVARFHVLIDELTVPLEKLHRERLQCKRGCADCCVDDITVYEVEADRIRRQHAALLESGMPHAPGACAFLDGEGACRIYEDRPYVCRTQGLPLRWAAEDEAGGVVERRDICELNVSESQPLVDVDPNHCWTLGPAETKLQQIEALHEGSAQDVEPGELRRVRLRDLFGV